MKSNGTRELCISLIVVATWTLAIGCSSDNDFLGLEDYQRDLLTWVLLNRPSEGTGLSCWDLDGDRVADAREDTNGDGEVDARDCDGLSCWDLDGNGVRDPDEDTNGDGVVDTDDCRCRVQLVFILDTSGSMDDQAQQICAAVDAIAGDPAASVVVDSQVFGIRTDLPPQPSAELYPCVLDSVAALEGVDPAGLDDEEDWGPATAAIAEQFPWPDGVLRVIVPVFDEDPQHDRQAEEAGVCSLCEDPGSDRDAIADAITAAAANNVLVFPIVGTPPEPADPGGCAVPDRDCIEQLARDLASDSSLRGFSAGIIQGIVDCACHQAAGLPCLGE